MKNSLLFFLFTMLSTMLIGQTVTPTSSTFQTGDDIVVEFTGSTHQLDWVGIYNEGETPDPGNGGVASITWFYINGTQDNTNTTVIPSGTLTYSVALPAGNYQVIMLCCDGYTPMATNTFSVEGDSPSELYPNNFPLVGGTVTFTFAGGPGNFDDWIGIYNPNDVPNTDASIMYQYIPGPPSAEGELTFDIGGANPLPAGDYKAIFFCCDLYTQLASTPFTVYEPTQPGLTPFGVLMEDAPNSFNYSGGTGSLSDWVGIYNHGDNPDPGNGGVESLFWGYVDAPNGLITLLQNDPDDLVAGNFYDAHFFCCDTYEPIASYENWPVAVFNATGEVADVPAIFTASTPEQGMVRLTFLESVNGEISVSNMAGQRTRSRSLNGMATIDFTGLQAGVYAVVFQDGKRSQPMKVVVH
jgi:hypothetical protein